MSRVLMHALARRLIVTALRMRTAPLNIAIHPTTIHAGEHGPHLPPATRTRKDLHQN